MKIGALELLVIFVVILLVIGPDKLPSYARKFGNAMREFRKASADVTQEIRESVIDPLEEAQAPLREAMEPLDELGRDLKADIKGVENDLNNLGKKSPKAAPAKQAEPEASAAPEDGAAPGEAPAPEPEAKDPASAAPEAGSAIEENGGDTP